MPRTLFSRRILAGLALSLLPASVMARPMAPPLRQRFIKGMVLPRVITTVGPFGQVFMVNEFDIYDGAKFVALDSVAGQMVVAELS